MGECKRGREGKATLGGGGAEAERSDQAGGRSLMLGGGILGLWVPSERGDGFRVDDCILSRAERPQPYWEREDQMLRAVNKVLTRKNQGSSYPNCALGSDHNTQAIPNMTQGHFLLELEG